MAGPALAWLDSLVWFWLGILSVYLIIGRPPIPWVSGLDFPVMGLAACLLARALVARRTAPRSPAWLAWGRAGLRRPLMASLIIAALWALVIWLHALARHALFITTEDLAVHLQGLWSITQGDLYYTSLRQMSHWGEHFNPTMLLLFPAFALAPGPGVLLLAQSLACAAGAPAIVWLARRELGPERAAWGLFLAVLYLGNPGLWGMARFDFHPIALAGGLWLWFFALRRDKPVLAWALALLALGLGEESWAVLLGHGLYLLLAERRWRAGLAIMALAVAGFLLVVMVVVPHFNLHVGGYYYTERFAGLGGEAGGGVTQILANLLTKPAQVWQVLSLPGKGEWVLALFLWVLFLPLARPLAMLWFAPVMAAVLVSSYPPQWSLHQHYTACILPGMYAAGVLGIGSLARRGLPAWLRPGPVVAAAALALIVVMDASPMGLVWRWAASPVQAQERAVAAVPPGEAVGADKHLVSHMALRWGLFDIAGCPESVPWVVLCDQPAPWPFTPEEHRLLSRRLKANGYKVVLEDGPCRVLHLAGGPVVEKRGRAQTPYIYNK